MDLTKCEPSSFYETIDCVKKDRLSTDAFLSINIDGIIGQALCPSFVEWESETSPSSSSVCCSPSTSIPPSGGQKFAFSDGELHPTHSLKGMPSDANALADHQECEQTGCRSVEVKNVLCEMNNSIEPGGFASEIYELISGLERKIEHPKDFASFSVDTPSFPTYITGSDRIASIENSMVDQFHGHGKIESISSNAESASGRDSTARSPILSSATIHADRNEIYLRDRIPRLFNVSVGEKELSRDDVFSKSLQSAALLRDEEDGQTVHLHERGRSEQPNSLKKSQNEVAPGWRKPPRPPRLAKHEANSSLYKSISDASHAYRVKKLERLHGKKKIKAGGRSPNLTLFLALVFTFCFCLLIAKSSR